MAESTQQKTSWTIKKLLEWTTDYFGKASLEQPRLSAEILLAHVLGCQRIDLYVQFDRCPEPGQLEEFRSLVQRAVDYEPVAYLTGTAHFFSMEFEVSPAVLIPRPETEVLAASVIDFCRHETIRPTIDVLDLCTGSGCIATAIAANVVETEVVAVDTSAAALEIARKNVTKHELEGRVSLLESDLFEQLDQAPKGIFDVIVSNPPYISTSAYENLPASVKNHEPADALRAGDDGLSIIRRIVTEAEPFLADDGVIMVEIAFDQSEQVLAIFEGSEYLTNVESVKDNLGQNRVIKAQKA